MTTALRYLAIALLLLVAFGGAGLSADPATDLQQINAQITALDRVPAGQIPPINPENLSWIDATLEQVQTETYPGAANQPVYQREIHYWEVRRQVSEEKLLALQLQKQVLETETQGQAVPADLQQRLAQAQATVAARELQGEAGAQATAAWNRVDAALQAVNLDYSWHIVKVHLLRDLVNRCRRVSYYVAESASSPAERERRWAAIRAANTQMPDWGLVSGDTAAFPKQINDLITRDRAWEVEYGECFFGRQEQELLGQGGDAATGLAERAEALATRLKTMDSDRADLERQVLAFLATLDTDGKFRDLGLPLRQPNMTIAADGKPSQLLFFELTFGSGYWSHGNDPTEVEPLCFDGEDLSFQPPALKERGVVADFDPLWLAKARKLAAAGYVFKQPLMVDDGWRPSQFWDIKLLPEAQRSDPDLFILGPDGKAGGFLNPWNPTMRSLLSDNLTAEARWCRDNIPNFLMYDKISWEPGALGGGYQDIFGYNSTAIQAFRTELATKFGTIAELNRAWHSNYASFDAIEPPPSPFHDSTFKPNPLSYEFERFRGESYTDFMAMCVRSIQAGDPGRPVGLSLTGIDGSFIQGNVPCYSLWKSFPAPLIDDHHNNWSPNYADLNFLYSLCLYTGKQPMESEYIWTFPRLAPITSEEDFRTTGELSVWRKMVWGRKVLNVFGTADGWDYNHNYMDERYSAIHQPAKYYGYGGSGRFVREAGTSLVLAKKRAREFWPYLQNTEVAKPKIGILVPATSMLNEYPWETLSKTYPVYERAFMRWDRLLGDRDLDFRYVPEEAILSGDENLHAFKVMVLPYVTYFPDGLAAKLLAWVKSGGTLIAEGVPGVYDAYGFDRPDLMRTVFGSDVQWKYTGEVGRGTFWRYELTVAPASKRAEVRATSQGQPMVVAGHYGAGTVLLSAESFNYFVHPGADNVDMFGPGMAYAVADKSGVVSRPESDHAMTDALFSVVMQAIGHPSAWSRQHKFELVTREDAQGRRYLFVVNAQLGETVTDDVFVAGVYAHVFDEGLGSHCEVAKLPTARADGSTAVSLRLAPGEGTVLYLAKRS
jgi:hypothetical protein